MRKGKIKALLFIIVFLLVMATAIALLLDMEREKKEVQELGYDPYAVTPVPTLAPTVTPMPVSTIMPTPVPPTPAPTPTLCRRQLPVFGHAGRQYRRQQCDPQHTHRHDHAHHPALRRRSAQRPDAGAVPLPRNLFPEGDRHHRMRRRDPAGEIKTACHSA